MRLIVAFKHKLSENFMERIKQRIIQRWTDSKYYHVEIAIGEYWIEADSDIGLVKHKLRPLNDKYDYISLKVPECKVNDITVERFINSQMGAEYDWTGIYLSQVFKLGIDKKDKWFCSELVSKVLQIYNIEPFLYIKPESLSPGDVYDILSKFKDVDSDMFIWDYA